MNAAQFIRALRQACKIAGLEQEHAKAAALEEPDARDVVDLLTVLQNMWTVESPLVVSRPADSTGGRPGRPRTRDHEEVLRMVADGMSDREIAERIGARWDEETGTSPAVRKIRRSHGLVHHDRRPGRRTGWEDRLRELHAAGKTVEEMAAETGWRATTVRQRLHMLKLRAHRQPKEP